MKKATFFLSKAHNYPSSSSRLSFILSQMAHLMSFLKCKNVTISQRFHKEQSRLLFCCLNLHQSVIACPHTKLIIHTNFRATWIEQDQIILKKHGKPPKFNLTYPLKHRNNDIGIIFKHNLLVNEFAFSYYRFGSGS